MFGPTGPALQFLRVEMAFEAAGYAIRNIEASPHRPPVAIFRMIRRNTPRYNSDVEFHQHALRILESAGIRIEKADLTTQKTGNQVLVAFLWRPAALPPAGRGDWG